MEAFAVFVSGAHSWYKHLPFYPPGAPLQFFLDPAAGMDLAFYPDRVEASRRAKTGFHYSSIPTNKYRKQFGYLAFSRSSGTTVYMKAADGATRAPADDVPAVYDPKTRSLRRLPNEIVTNGTAFISGLVHVTGASPDWAFDCASPSAIAAWPAESGGPDALAALAEQFKVLRDEMWATRRFSMESEDSPFSKLLAPERRRQRQGMVDAMARVVDLVHRRTAT